MADSRDRQHRAHVAGTVAGVAAGTASAPFGAAKLRDSFRESYPVKFRRGLAHVEHVARREGMSQQQTSRVLRVASHGKPGFVPLVAATTAASLAGGARRYERHLQHKEAMAKSAFGVDHFSKADHLAVVSQRKRAYSAANYDIVAARQGQGPNRNRISTGAEHGEQVDASLESLHSSIRSAHAAGHAPKEIARAAKWPIKSVTALISKRMPDGISRSAFGIVHPGLVTKGEGSSAAVKAGSAAIGNPMLAARRKVCKSAFDIGYPLEKADRRRAVEVGAGGGAVLSGRSAVRSRRAGRGHLVRAADLERDSNASFAASRGQGDVVAQRLARHVSSGPGSLPRTDGNLAITGRQHMRGQAHLHAGLTSRDASHAAASAGAKALRRSKGRLVLAAGLAGTAAVASTSRKRY